MKTRSNAAQSLLQIRRVVLNRLAQVLVHAILTRNTKRKPRTYLPSVSKLFKPAEKKSRAFAQLFKNLLQQIYICVLHAKLVFPQKRRVGLERREAARLRDLPDGLSGGLRRLGGVGDQQTVEPAFSMRAYVVGAEKRRPVLNILQRRRFCAAVNKEQEEITGDTLPASSRPYRPDAIPLCRCCASGRADRAAALYADTRFLFRAARFAGQRVHDWQNSA